MRKYLTLILVYVLDLYTEIAATQSDDDVVFTAGRLTAALQIQRAKQQAQEAARETLVQLQAQPPWWMPTPPPGR